MELRLSAQGIAVGNVVDAAAVRDAVPRHDAVVSTLGVDVPLEHDPSVIDGIGHIVEAMRAEGVRRLIYQSLIGVTESRAALGFVLLYIAAGSSRARELVKNSYASSQTKELVSAQFTSRR